MTTTFLLFGVPLLALAGGVATWWLYGRRERDGSVAAATTDRRRSVPRSAEPAARSEEPHRPSPGWSGKDILARMYAAAFDGRASGDRRVDPRNGDHAKVARAAIAVLSRIHSGSHYAPRRPQLLPQLLNVVNDEDSSGRDIAAIISRDPALAGNLLRIANSALYRVRPEPIENIERAVAMIGTDGLRHLIAVALMQPVLSDRGGAFGRLPAVVWEHTLLSAVVAAEYARHVEGIDPFSAQMLGLLHGLGSIVVVQVVRDSYEQHTDVAPDPGRVRQLLEQWSAQTALRLQQGWNLPVRIAPALEDQGRDVPLAELSPLGRSLRIGHMVGAAAMLHRLHQIDVDTVFVLMQQELGLREELAARIWERLSRT
jgi:HD-like signal output (HDOD) protein